MLWASPVHNQWGETRPPSQPWPMLSVLPSLLAVDNNVSYTLSHNHSRCFKPHPLSRPHLISQSQGHCNKPRLLWQLQQILWASPSLTIMAIIASFVRSQDYGKCCELCPLSRLWSMLWILPSLKAITNVVNLALSHDYGNCCCGLCALSRLHMAMLWTLSSLTILADVVSLPLSQDCGRCEPVGILPHVPVDILIVCRLFL
jgi:hypothetical protein